MASYVLSLMVTIQQEEAIQKLFQHNDWLYIKVDCSNDVKAYPDHGPDASNIDNTAVECVSNCVDSNIKVVSDNELHALGITVKQEIDSDDNNDDILEEDNKSEDTNTELRTRRSPRSKNTKINTVTKSKTLKNKRTSASSAKGKRTKCIASNIRKDSSSSHKRRKIVDLPSSSGDSVSTDKVSVKSENVDNPGADIYTILEENPDIKHISELLKPNSVSLKQSGNESNTVSLEQQRVESNNISLEEPTNKSNSISLEQPANKTNDLSLEQPTNDMVPNDLDTNSYSASLSVYYCNSCCYTFPLREYFDQHKREGLCVFICQFCKEMFTFRNFMAYQEHLRKHRHTVGTKRDYSALKLQLCQLCNHYFRSKSFYQHTCVQNLQQKPYYDSDVCELERVSSESENSLNLKAKRSYTCDRCPTLKFSTSAALRCHTRREHDNVFQCNICHRKFGMSRHLREHMLSHTSTRDYKCHKCGASLKYKKSLVRHLQTCNGKLKTKGRKKRCDRELSYPCPECGKIFTTRRLLQQHVYTHGQPDKPCYKCGNTYKHYSALSRHIQKCPF
ncbi:Zinc finger and BTB domain-containing protein 41 [Mactra antiquata]